MANKTIPDLPAAGVLTGAESVPIVQNGITVRTTTAAIAAAPSLTQTFLTLNNEPTLPNSRYFSVGTGLGLTDNGAQSNLVLSLNGASGSLETAGNGFIAKTASNTVAARTLTASGSGLSITNGDGVSGSPQFALTGLVGALANLPGGGMLAAVDPSTVLQRSITGTSNQISVSDGSGVLGNPTIAIASNPIIPGTAGMTLPSGNTSQRSGSPVNGTIRYNTDSAVLEGYANNAWGAIAVGSGVVSIDVSGGSTGLTTTGGPITSSGVITLGGTLLVTSGGTGVSSYVAGDTLYYSTGTALSKLAIGSSTHIMTSTGSAPQWTDPATITVGTATSAATATTATTATNLAGGSAGSIPYQTGSGSTAMLATASGVLVGGTTPSYSTAPALTGTNFSSIPNGALTNSSITIGTTTINLGSSSLTLGGLTSVALTQDPTTALQAATKQYVDGLVTSGITYHTPVKYEVPSTTGNLNATYNNGTAGVGATLTNNGTLAAFAPDGPTAQVGDRILIYNQTNQFENGVYEVTTVGSGSVAWVLTRAADADSYGLKDPNALGNGDAFFVTSGDTGAGELYVCNTTGTITFGTTAITFAQVSSAQIYSAGTGLTLAGTQFSLTTPVLLANGGTGLTSYTAGDLPYFASGTAFSKLAIGASSRILTSSGTAPQWTDPSTITVGSATSATTATNVAGGAADRIVYNTGSGTTGFIVAPTVASTVLQWTGSAFQWSSVGAGTVTSVDVSGGTTGLTFSGGPITSSGTITMAGTLAIANGGTNATASPTAGAVAYGTGTAYAFSLAGTTNQVLLSGGTGSPTWSNQSSLAVGSATNVAGGAANQIVYNTGSGATSFITAPTSANTFLEWSGSAFQWSSNPLGDVVGPASATDNAVARFNGTTGKLIQNSAVTIADTTGDITGGAYNKVTITAPATSATLTIADGKTLTANNSITLAGTDATTMTFPSTSQTVAGLGLAQTFTAAQTFRAANAIRSEAASTQDAIVIAGRAGGTGSFASTITPTTLSANRTVTLPNADINFTTGLGVANGGTGTTTLTANNVILGNGASAVQFVAPSTSGNVLTSNGTTWTSAAPAVTLAGNNAFTGANTFYNATGQTFGTATAAQDGIILAGRAGGTSTYRITLTPATLSASRTLTLPDPGSNETLGYLNIPQNSQSAAYTLVLTDAGKHILHPSADTTARTFTIPANGTVAFPIGTAVTFINQNGAGVVTIAITTDTMRLAGAGTTGSRTLAANGVATAIKITSTEWIISGVGLT